MLIIGMLKKQLLIVRIGPYTNVLKKLKIVLPPTSEYLLCACVNLYIFMHFCMSVSMFALTMNVFYVYPAVLWCMLVVWRSCLLCTLDVVTLTS